MRIIIFSYDYPPNNGGISRLCGEIRKELINRNISVHVITCAKGEEEEGIERVTGRRGVIELKMRHALKKIYRPGDIILTDTWHPAGMLARTISKDVYILAHGAEFLPSKGLSNSKLWNLYRRVVLIKAKGIIANSHYTDNLVRQCSKKISSIAIPLAVDSAYFHPTEGKKTNDNILRICSLSRLQKFKGHDFILRTISKLPSSYQKRLLLEIGGKGEYRKDLERLSHDLGIENIVHFLGFMPDEDVLDFYSRNDVFILCSREEPEDRNVEGFGLVFIEAQACGTAAIGTRTGGIPDAICDGNGGWLIDQDNEDQLIDLLKKLIDDKRMAQNEGMKARSRVVEKCNWTKYCSELLNFIGY